MQAKTHECGKCQDDIRIRGLPFNNGEYKVTSKRYTKSSYIKFIIEKIMSIIEPIGWLYYRHMVDLKGKFQYENEVAVRE